MKRRYGGSVVLDDRVLRRHIKSALKDNRSADVDQLVDHLRSNYPQYSRQKLTPFRNKVGRIMAQVFPKPKRLAGNDSDKKEFSNCGDRGEMFNSHSSSGNVSSMREDASTSEEYEPEFDLTKSMMREKLLQKWKNEGKQDVELEVLDNEDVKSIGTDNGAKLKLDDAGRASRDGGYVAQGPNFKDLGGMGDVIKMLTMKVIMPLCQPEVPRFLRVKPISGILLHGPPGCGKTKLAHAIANETGLPFYKTSATKLVSGVSGASEENIRLLFDKANRTAPSIVFIDEIDAIASKRENLQRETDRRILIQLMTCMDESHTITEHVDDTLDSECSHTGLGCYVLVIGATNRADAIDPALRRGGRLDREIYVGVPDVSARFEILSALTRKLRVEGDFDLIKVANSTPGFVGADLAALTNEAGIFAMERIFEQRMVELSKEDAAMKLEELCRQPWSDDEIKSLRVTMADFDAAAKSVQPSLTREGFSEIPNVKWDDVGGLQSLRQKFDRYIVRRIKFPAYYEGLGVDLDPGFLLFGPPGCGKTLIAQAVANEAGANFIYVKGPELLNKYVGESELSVRTLFNRARACTPCILFFDEVEALTTKRGNEGGWVVERVLNQLLIELDGAERRRGVFVIGATNRPEIMDPAILRPGRLGKLMYVPLPSPNERGMILKALSRNKLIGCDVDLMSIGRACKKFSGSDLAALVEEAAMAVALTDDDMEPGCSDGGTKIIKNEHFRRAFEEISPSVSDDQSKYYQDFSQRLLKGRVQLDSASFTLPT